eukprot:194099_1
MGAGTSIPYTILAANHQLPLWQIHEASRKSDGLEVSVFNLDLKRAHPEQVTLARSSLKRLRTLRHPNILPFIDGSDTVEGISVVTERVTSLDKLLRDGEMKNVNEIALGLHEIATAISFMNNDCGLSHTNISTSSIFVTKSGDWKLGGVELVFDVKYPAPMEVRRNIKHLLPSPYLPMEVARDNWNGVVSKSCAWSIDAWCFGCVIYECFNGSLSRPQNLTSTGQIPKQILPEYRKLLNNNPDIRISPAKLRDSAFMNNPLVKTIDFLQNIALKSEVEMMQFFKGLAKNIDKFPKACCCYKILPILTHALQHGSETNSSVLTSVLKIGKHLSPEDYEKMVVPCVVKLFSSNERSTRLNLLANMGDYIDSLNNKIVTDSIFPSVASGFSDTLPVLREQTVRSMCLIAPKLSSSVLHSKLLLYLNKLQTDMEPAIRTDTVIVFGKIAENIGEDKRARTLYSAFARALKDSFSPARLCAIQAFQACAKHFAPDQISKQVIPVIAPHTLDPDKNVRAATFQCIKDLMPFLEKQSKKMAEMEETQVNGVEPSSAQSTASRSAVKAIGSFSQWAVSSLKTKVYGNIENGHTSQQSSEGGNVAGSSGSVESRRMEPSGRKENNISRSSNDSKPSARQQSREPPSRRAAKLSPKKNDAFFEEDDDFFDDFTNDNGGGEEVEEDPLNILLSKRSQPLAGRRAAKPKKSTEKRNSSARTSSAKIQSKPFTSSVSAIDTVAVSSNIEDFDFDFDADEVKQVSLTKTKLGSNRRGSKKSSKHQSESTDFFSDLLSDNVSEKQTPQNIKQNRRGSKKPSRTPSESSDLFSDFISMSAESTPKGSQRKKSSERSRKSGKTMSQMKKKAVVSANNDEDDDWDFNF